VVLGLKRVLANGLGAVLGFPVYSSLTTAPDIPFPTQSDFLQGGHAVMVVGYDDEHMADGKKVGSFIIRNSWGGDWGLGGYGFLPYEYVKQALAVDIWTVLKTEWLDLEPFD
jgi:C1A family cysteine protease